EEDRRLADADDDAPDLVEPVRLGRLVLHLPVAHVLQLAGLFQVLQRRVAGVDPIRLRESGEKGADHRHDEGKSGASYPRLQFHTRVGRDQRDDGGRHALRALFDFCFAGHDHASLTAAPTCYFGVDVTSAARGVTMPRYAAAPATPPDDLAARRGPTLPDGGRRGEHVEVRPAQRPRVRGCSAKSVTKTKA